MTGKNEKVVQVAADCTGHGVPGLFMSMLGFHFSTRIVNKENVLQPEKFLNSFASISKQPFHKQGRN